MRSSRSSFSPLDLETADEADLNEGSVWFLDSKNKVEDNQDEKVKRGWFSNSSDEDEDEEKEEVFSTPHSIPPPTLPRSRRCRTKAGLPMTALIPT